MPLYTESQQNYTPAELANPYSQPPGFAPSPAYVPSAYAPPARQGSNWILTLLIGAGGVLVVCSLLIVAAVWWAVSSVEGWIVGLGREGIVAMVEESDIPADEQKEVVAQVDRVVAAFKAGEIDQDDLNRLLENLDLSPAMAYISCAGMEEYYLADCDLAPQQQVRARSAFGRALYGVSQGNIDEDEFYDALPDDEQFVRALDESTEAAGTILEKSVERIEKLADRAGVPVNPPAVDVGGEVTRLVDQLLAGQ